MEKNDSVIPKPWHKRLNCFEWSVVVAIIISFLFIMIRMLIEDNISLRLTDIGIIIIIMAGISPVCSLYILLCFAAIYSCADKYTPWLGNKGVISRFVFWIVSWKFILPFFLMGLAILAYMFWPIKNMGRLAVLFLIEMPLYSVIFGAIIGGILRVFSRTTNHKRLKK